MVSKELLSEVLGYKITYFDINNNQLFYEYKTYKIERNGISMATFIEKCELFILEKGFQISLHSNKDDTWNLNLIEKETNIHHVIGDKIQDKHTGINEILNYRTSFKDKRVLIIKACTWILGKMR